LHDSGYRVPARLAVLSRLARWCSITSRTRAARDRAVPLFQAVFSWAKAPQNIYQQRRPGHEHLAERRAAPGPLRSLRRRRGRRHRQCAGVPAQILICSCSSSPWRIPGYLPRAAFMLDRLMGRVGLSGRAFIPRLSKLACAIPASWRRAPSLARDRLATIMIAPS